MKNLKVLECVACGKVFRTDGGADTCPTCIRKSRPKKGKPKQSLEDICRELADYNEEHGTSLTYGQYAAMQNANGRI